MNATESCTLWGDFMVCELDLLHLNTDINQKKKKTRKKKPNFKIYWTLYQVYIILG